MDDATSTNALFAEATAAAARGDAPGMIEALAEIRALDGMRRRIQSKWERLPAHEVDECVATAVDEVYEKLRSGGTAHSLGGLLYRISDRRAYERWNYDYLLRNETDGSDPTAETGTEGPEARAVRDAEAEKRRSGAVQLARALLPRLGEGQIVRVMEVVIDAVEHGDHDLSARDVAALVGIPPASARTLMSRGLSRLRERVEAEGHDPLGDLIELDELQEDTDNAEA